MSELSVADVQRLLEEHKFYTPEWVSSYDGTRYPERWDSISDGDFGWEKWVEETSEKSPESVEGLGLVYCVASYGGEGQGDEYWFVLRVVSPDGTERYFRMGGYYQSYSGGEYDGELREVKPVVREVTFYE